MKLVIRMMGAGDTAAWGRMRAALWPDETPLGHAKAIDELLADEEAWAFIAELKGDGAAGFAEVALRKYVNGCDSRPVPFLEGVWVRPELRRQGIGARLILHAESFFAARGFRELGSDTLMDNTSSQAAHRAWGFSETERVVYFRKILGPAGRQE
jgi:aminoglycoside 6'-N-acetyltransferase I